MKLKSIRTKFLCAFTALLALLLPAIVAAAPPSRFTHLSVEQGLSQSSVQAILQDHTGFLWFGTEEGLDRYDGYSFVVFKHNPRNPKSLPDDVISALHEDRQGRLWVGTQQGLSVFDPRTETFTPFPTIHARVTGIVEEPDGTLWVGTEEEGIFERNPSTGLFLPHQPSPQDSASLASWTVRVLFRDSKGRLWIGTNDAGIDMLERDRKRFVHHRHDSHDPRSLSHDDVWGIAEDNAGNLWVATHGGGLNVLDHESGAFRHYRPRPNDPHSLRTDLLTYLFFDRAGSLWIGTDGAGLERYDTASHGFIAYAYDQADPASLSQSVVRTIYEDVQNQLWVGTYWGGANLFKASRRAFTHFTHDPRDSSSLSDPSVACFLDDKEGKIWMGTEQGWLNRFERETGKFARYHFPSVVPGGRAILSLHQDRRGRVWVGTYKRGLGRFDPAHGTFAIYRHRPSDLKSLSNDEVWAIAEDEAGALWLGTNAGVDRFDPDLGIVTAHYGSSEVTKPLEVRALLSDRQGNLWVGTLTGLNLLRRGSDSFVHYQHNAADPRSLGNDAVVALHEGRDGQLWVGTFGGGLNLFDPATGGFTAYKEFPSNVIYGIQEDSSGLLWLSTNHGLARFNPTTGEAGSYDLTNGLESLQFHLGASLKTRSGRILFGSIDGFYDFDPGEIKPDTFAPPVVLTSVRILNEPAKLPNTLSALNGVSLSPRDKIFSFEFAALDYNFPRRNQYAYRMDGFSQEWLQLGSRREVTFTNLDPGGYVFRVKASNSDGVWNEASAVTLNVVVRPPFWRTWWFRGLSVAMFAVFLWAVHRFLVRRLTTIIDDRKLVQEALVQRAVELARSNEERKRAQEELARRAEELARSNAELEQFAYVASHDLQEPLRMVASYTQLLARRYKGKLDKDADEFISFAVDGATRMQRLIQDLLSYSRVATRGKTLQPTDSKLACENALANLQASIKESGTTVFVDPLPKVMADDSQLCQVFQNLVGNAIKYRNEHKPEVRIAAKPDGHNWIFSVQDNGIGIDPQYFERIFQMFQRLHTRTEYAGTGIGLALCRKIVERHGGKIWVESQPGHGSTFLFTMPRAERTET